MILSKKILHGHTWVYLQILHLSLQPQPQVQPQPSETSKIDLKTPSFIPVENLEAAQQPPTPSTPGAAVPNHDETPVFAASCNIEPDSLDPDINNENNGLNGEDPKPGIFLLPLGVRELGAQLYMN